ncbi:hypothetical protein JCM10212_002176 [Sporobolomyces blumeae]
MIPPLPHEIMLLIFEYLAPVEDASAMLSGDEFGQAEQRRVGSVISLVSRKYTRHGQAILWRSARLDCKDEETTRTKIDALTTHAHLADKVRCLCIIDRNNASYCVLERSIEVLLASLPLLSSLELNGRPDFVQHLISPPSLVTLPRLRHLGLHTAGRPTWIDTTP